MWQEPDLHGRTALITGAGRGIGRATALLLAQVGARTILAARGRAELEDVAALIRGSGGEALALTGDISNRSDMDRLFTQAGPVDILVNNAGTIQPISPLATSDPVAWTRSIAVNLNGVYLPMRAALPGMLERGWGHIINVSSGAARGSTTGWSAYSAAKAGVEAMTTVVAAEVAGRGVHINAIRPGVVDTQMQVEIRSSSEEQFGRANLDRFRGWKERGTLRAPGEPARLILWLLSTDAQEMHGQVIGIDDEAIAQRAGLRIIGRQ